MQRTRHATIAAVLVAAAVVVLLVGPFFDVGSGPERSRESDATSGTATAAAGGHAMPTARTGPDAGTEAVHSRRTAAPELYEDPTTAAARPDPLAAHEARVRGRLVRPGGAPVAGATTRLEFDRHRSLVHAPHAHFADVDEEVRVLSDSDGSFELLVRTQASALHDFRAEADMAPPVHVELPHIEPGSTLELGAVVVPLWGAAELRIVSRSGDPVVGPWTAQSLVSWHSRWRSDSTVNPRWERLEDGSGVRCVSLPPGLIEVRLGNGFDFHTIVRTIGVTAGATARHTCEVSLDVALDERLVVAWDSPLLDWFPPPRADRMHVSRDGAPSGGQYLERLLDRPCSEWRGVSAGRHQLDVDDARFESILARSVSTGHRELVGVSGSVELLFDVCTADGRPPSDVSFDVLSFGAPRRSLAHPARCEPLPGSTPGAARVRTVPDPQIWIVTAAGHAPRFVPFADGFAPGERATVPVVLEPRRTIAGRVVDAQGHGVAGVDVMAHDTPDGAYEPWSAVSWTGARTAEQVLDSVARRTWTDADGRFELGHLAARTHVDLAARSRSGLVAASNRVPVGTPDVVLSLPPTGRLVGRVEPDFTGRELYWVVAKAVAPTLERQRTTWRTSVGADGTFALDDLPSGAFDVRLVPRTLGGPGEHLPRSESELATQRILIEHGVATDVRFDLRHATPACLRVRLHETSGSGTELVLCVERWSSAERAWSPEQRAEIGPDGHVLVALEQPGPRRLRYQSHARTWSAPLPGEYAPRPGTVVELEFDVALVAAEIVFEERAGVPVDFAELVFVDPWCRESVTSAEGGRCHLELPPGTYRLAAVDAFLDEEPQREPVELVWTSDGPRDAVLVIAGAD